MQESIIIITVDIVLLTVAVKSLLLYFNRVSNPRIWDSTVFNSDSFRDFFKDSRSSSVSFSYETYIVHCEQLKIKTNNVHRM